jgi:hypothetical protein
MSDDKIIPFKTSINPVTNRPRIEMITSDIDLADRVKRFITRAQGQPTEEAWFVNLRILEETMIEMIRLKGVQAVEEAVGRQLDAGWAALEGAERSND